MSPYVPHRARRWTTSVMFLCVATTIAAKAGRLSADSGEIASPIEDGRALFVRQWTEYDEQTPNGDGLGPMFNARSCVDCHHQGGVGGSGKLDKNVDLLCLIPPQQLTRVDRQKFVAGIKKIHPGFVSNTSTALPSITLHKFGTHPAYDNWRVALLMLVDLLPENEVPDRIAFKVFQRRTPSLFGAGLIDSIPKQILEQAARRQAKGPNHIRGRVALATAGGVGKFGWRGQTSSLKQFVLGACANELGLHVPSTNQPLDPLAPGEKPPGLDLDQKQCDALVAFVASLPAPAERQPLTRWEKEQWTAGALVYKQVGCAECHPSKLGEVAGIYSDLLLHDMGPDLADPAGPNIPGRLGGVVTVPSNVYYGGTQDVLVAVPPETQRQWRTPPLWGLADRAPYLHDGRAPSVDDAILRHGGEATAVRDKYAALTREKRARLLAFLGSVGAPQGAK